jgi:diketogulonate reductase-like aldo/keto reductase
MLAASGVPRSDFFVMTKIMPDNFLPAATRDDNGSAARVEGDQSPVDYFKKQLAELRTGYVDVLFTHHLARDDYFQQTWKKMEQVQLDGQARFLGVSSFKDLQSARDCMASGVCRTQSRIFMQIPWTPCASATWPEGWPYIDMTELTDVVLVNHDIAICRDEPVVNALARHHRTNFYTIVLSWARQFNITSLFQAYTLEHLQADLETRVGLSQEEMAVLYGLQAVYAHSADPYGLDANCPAVHLGNLAHDPLGLRLLYANLSDVAGSNCAMSMTSPEDDEDDLGADGPKGRMVRLEVFNNGDTDVEIFKHLRGEGLFGTEREEVVHPHSTVRDDEVEDGEIFDVVAGKDGYRQVVKVDADQGLEQRIVIPPRIIRRHG